MQNGGSLELWADYLPADSQILGIDIASKVHTSYFAFHGSGFRNPASSIESLKDLVDVINADHIQTEADRDRLSMRRLNATIRRVAFYDSVCVVEKLPVEKARPYRRVCG